MGRLKATQAHAERMKELKDRVEKAVALKSVPRKWLAITSYYAAQAERMVEAASAAAAVSQSAVETPAAEAAAEQPSADETAAAEVFKRLTGLYEKGRSEGPESQYVWSRRWMDAQAARNPSPAGRLEAAQAHAERMKQLKAIAEDQVAVREGLAQSAGKGVVQQDDGSAAARVAMANFYVAEAERMVAALGAKTAEAKAAASEPAALGALPGADSDFEPEPPLMPDVPLREQVLEIEQRILAERRSLETGRVEIEVIRPKTSLGPDGIEQRSMRTEQKLVLYFDGPKKRIDTIGARRARTWFRPPPRSIAGGRANPKRSRLSPKRPRPTPTKWPMPA